MIITIIDQITAWVCVLCSWWVINMVGGLRRACTRWWDCLGVGMMCLSIALFGFLQAILAIDRLSMFHFFDVIDVDFKLAGAVLRTPVIFLLIGIAVFHKARFGRV